MTFPVVESVRRHFSTSNTTQKRLFIPATVQSGWLLLGLISQELGNSFNSIAPGWTEIQGGAHQAHVVAKIADGSEGGGSALFTTISAFGYSCHCYAISGWSGNLADIAMSRDDSGGSSNVNPDCPSLTVPWGAQDTLWVAFASHKATVSVSVGPTGFTSPIWDSNTSSGATETCISCTDEDNIATKDPSAYTVSVSQQWGTATIAIKPAAVTVDIEALAYDPIEDRLFVELSGTNPDLKVIPSASIQTSQTWVGSFQPVTSPGITVPGDGQNVILTIN